MILGTIMKPLRDGRKADGKKTFPSTVDVYAIDEEALRAMDEKIYIADDDGRCVGYINRDTLLYLKNNNTLSQMSSIMNYIEDAAVAVDKNGYIFYANEVYTFILGVPLGKIIGKSLHTIESEAALIEVLETKEPVVKKKTYIKSIDKVVSVRMFPLFIDHEFQGAVSIFKDVTETNNLNNEIKRISEEAKEYRAQLHANDSIEALNIIGDDPQFQKTMSQALVVAKTDATVLIRGENGTGKEMLAKLVQQNSLRKDGPFITVNCAAIPENLIESELFGYEDGAFTGAKKGGKIGKFQLADGGTIFLDEIGDMPISMQTKLLRVLQENEIEKIGKSGNISINVRVIAATNQPLEELIKQKLFRRDLFYRLNVISLVIPPLRERPHDVVLLINHFLFKFNAQYEKALTIEHSCYNTLLKYGWPGNIRELRSCIEYAVILCGGKEITPQDLPDSIDKDTFPTHSDLELPRDEATPISPLRQCLEQYERELLVKALKKTDGNKTEAMEQLGLSRRTFYRKLSQYKI